MKGFRSDSRILVVLFKIFIFGLRFGVKVVFISVLGVSGFIVIPVSWLLTFLYVGFQPELFYRIVARWLYYFEKVFFSLTVEGKENLPEQSFVLIAPHQSYWDIPILAYIVGPKRPMTFVARKGFFFLEWPPLNDFCIFIDRKKTRMRRLLSESEKALKERPLVVFPEGSTHPQFKEVKASALLLAKKLESSIVPVRFKDAGFYGKPNGSVWAYLARRVNLTVEIGRPVELENIEDKISRSKEEKKSDYYRRVIKNLLKISD